MSIPSKITGAGNNSIAQNVLRVTFSEATSDIPRLEAWDSYAFTTTVNEVFAGTAGNSNKPMIAAVATTNAAPISAWVPAAVTAGGATINLLKGSTNFVNLSNAVVAQGGTVRFNLNWKVPFDAAIPSNMAAVLVIRFSYTGPAPILTWAFNDSAGGGTEGVPVWTNITPGLGGNKIKPADAGSSAGNIILHRPVAGTVDAGEIWVATS